VAVIVSVAISHLNSFFDKTCLQVIIIGGLAVFWSCITYVNKKTNNSIQKTSKKYSNIKTEISQDHVDEDLAMKTTLLTLENTPLRGKTRGKVSLAPGSFKIYCYGAATNSSEEKAGMAAG
jgi:hypothetical protein